MGHEEENARRVGREMQRGFCDYIISAGLWVAKWQTKVRRIYCLRKCFRLGKL